MKVFFVISVMGLTLIGLSNGNRNSSPLSVLPCVMCAREYKPVCAVPTSGESQPETFHNRCMVLVRDCGKKEPRKILKFIIPDLNAYHFLSQNSEFSTKVYAGTLAVVSTSKLKSDAITLITFDSSCDENLVSTRNKTR